VLTHDTTQPSPITSLSRMCTSPCHQPSAIILPSTHELPNSTTMVFCRPSGWYNHVLSAESERDSLSGTSTAKEPTSFNVSTHLVFKIRHHTAWTHLLGFQFLMGDSHAF
jgi:hypothetical protein